MSIASMDVRSCAWFLNKARQLYCLDYHVINNAGIPMTDHRWREFRSNPVHFMLQVDDETAMKIWALLP